jgi:nifR3 family TIM-barrel protein
MLAPIAGFTDRPTRDIARAKGCPLTFSELISARGLQENNPGTLKMLHECRDEHPLVIQLFGGEPDVISEAVRKVEQLGADGVNLNLGCPVRKVFKNRSGCGLTIFPVELVHVIRAMRKASDIHLSVKIRAGVNHRSLNYRLIGDIAQGEGCDAIIFHARTRMMGFGGHAQWEWIGDLKEYLDIPVIGNGDVVDAQSARAMLDETGCDGVMIARASYGNPWIFAAVERYLESGYQRSPPTLEERYATMVHHLHLAVENKGERRGILEMRKQLGWYLKGIALVRPLRETINRLETLPKVLTALEQWRESVENRVNNEREYRAENELMPFSI